MITVQGRGGIKATIVADSIANDIRITTYELEYPRFIHAEFMTHRMFSRNAASSRAIPIEKMIEQVETNPAMPIHWGKNQSGMQAKEELTDTLTSAKGGWRDAAEEAAQAASWLNSCGLHKQLTNRVLEPYQMIKVVCTATEYANFFYLRNHEDAQPEIAELARVMADAREVSEPQTLRAGEWHLPYLESGYCKSTESFMYYCEGEVVSPEDAIKISASLCAQVSYRKSDESLDKALKIYDMLVTMKPVHASPLEHQATPMANPKQKYGHWGGEGTTHLDGDSNFWSGNFKGWIQHRQLIKGHVYNG